MAQRVAGGMASAAGVKVGSMIRWWTRANLLRASPPRVQWEPAGNRGDGSAQATRPQRCNSAWPAWTPPTAPADPGFLERGGLRRRLRFLRKTRELAYRDLGGLVFEMHRLGQQREDLLASKLATLGASTPSCGRSRRPCASAAG